MISDGRLTTLETHFNEAHERWRNAPEGNLQTVVFRKVNRITDSILGTRAHGIEGMRVKMRTWMTWYGDGTGFPEDAVALIASLASDLDLQEELAAGVSIQ